MKRFSALKSATTILATLCLLAPAARAQLANLKVVTDANPDYSDMESMVRSITSRWESDADKMWALFYWDHIARRQTPPMWVHGYELTDPIRQFNDYGFTMCSTISGIKCSEWNYMGYPCRFWEIFQHTVCDVWYDGGFHHYDNSLSTMYTLADGKTIASVQDIGKTGSGPETGGKDVKGYIARYHCLFATGLDSYLQGADTERPLKHLFDCFDPKGIHYQYQYYNQDRGHRYILNMREGEIYTRSYSKLDSDLSVTIPLKNDKTFKSDPACYVPNLGKDSDNAQDDPQAHTRCDIRANGQRHFAPILDDAHLLGDVYSTANIKALSPGLQSAAAGQPGEAVFKIEGANVITSLKIHGSAQTATADDAVAIALSTTNGLQWKEIWKSAKAGENPVDVKLINEVNGSYEVLVKVTLQPKANPADAQLNSIGFDTITQINRDTQPQLHIGANTIYVGVGDQTQSIVFWPEWRDDLYKPYTVDEKNVKVMGKKHFTLAPQKPGAEGYVVFKIDAPTDITSFTYGGRYANHAPGSHIDLLHSYDGGKTWNNDDSFTDTTMPTDVVHYQTVSEVPAGVKSVLLKYSINAGKSTGDGAPPCVINSVRMEVDHKLAAPVDVAKEPVEVTFNWSERQQDYSLVQRSHTQLVDHLPTTYTINVGGADHPVVNSLTVNLKGARPEVKYGYSDGKDAGGQKWVPVWATYGNDLALHKKYTVSVPSESGETYKGAGDPDGKRLTDGRVASSYTGGDNLKDALWWSANANPEIVVDLGQSQKCAAFRIHTFGYPAADALQGQIKDKIEVLVSDDGTAFKSAGFFDTNLRYKDIPINFMLPDDETLKGPNLFFAPKDPVDARFVKFKITNARVFNSSEVQVLDSFSFEPHDMRIALPDPASNGKPALKADVSPNARKWDPKDFPTNLGKPIVKQKDAE